MSATFLLCVLCLFLTPDQGLADLDNSLDDRIAKVEKMMETIVREAAVKDTRIAALETAIDEKKRVRYAPILFLTKDAYLQL